MKARTADRETEEMRLVTQRGVKSAPLPAKYEAAQRALAACQKIDECSTWAKKAAALASYARQAGDRSMEQMAMRIRARAVERCGKLLGEIDRAKGGRPKKHLPTGAGVSARSQAARDAGLSEKEKVTALRVAAVDRDLFESAVEREDPATVTELADMGTKKKPVPLVDIQGRDPKEFNDALHLQAGIARLAETVSVSPVGPFVRGCLPEDIKELKQNADLLRVWLSNLLKEIE